MSNYGRPDQRMGGGRPGQDRQQGPPPFPAPSEAQLKAIILQGDAKTLVDSAQAMGKGLKDSDLTTSQIRGVFGTVRLIQMKWPHGASDTEDRSALRQLLLLKPKMAYQASRDRGSGVNNLQQVLAPAIDLVTTREQFDHLVDYFEAILAYHKAAGGRD